MYYIHDIKYAFARMPELGKIPKKNEKNSWGEKLTHITYKQAVIICSNATSLCKDSTLELNSFFVIRFDLNLVREKSYFLLLSLDTSPLNMFVLKRLCLLQTLKEV